MTMILLHLLAHAEYEHGNVGHGHTNTDTGTVTDRVTDMAMVMETDMD
jgi:hypothetical protein